MFKDLITIEKSDNGYIMRAPSDAITRDYGEVVTVFETYDDYSRKCACNGVVRLLYGILESLGELGSKHDAHRVHIGCKCEDGGEQCTG